MIRYINAQDSPFSHVILESIETTKAWFSPAYEHKHKDIRTRRMAFLTQFSMPALLNPMINKMADASSAILLLIGTHEVWVKVAYDSTPFSPVKATNKHKYKHKKNELVRFSCAYAYVNPVFTCLHMCLWLYLILCLCASENQA